MHVLVTGGAGYIGSISVRALLDAGHDVTVLDSLERGYAAAVDPRAELVRASVGDADALARVLPGTDVVLHIAGYIEVAESEENPELYYRKNVDEPSVGVSSSPPPPRSTESPTRSQSPKRHRLGRSTSTARRSLPSSAGSRRPRQ